MQRKQRKWIRRGNLICWNTSRDWTFLIPSCILLSSPLPFLLPTPLPTPWVRLPHAPEGIADCFQLPRICMHSDIIQRAYPSELTEVNSLWCGTEKNRCKFQSDGGGRDLWLSSELDGVLTEQRGGRKLTPPPPPTSPDRSKLLWFIEVA